MVMNAPGTMNDLLMDAVVGMSLYMTAQILGIPQETVTRIVQVGMPMVARMAQDSPDLFSALYAESVKMLPEPMQVFYEKLATSPEAQTKLAEEFSKMYGPMLEAINREAATQTGTSEAEAGKVLATTLPGISHAAGKATEGTGEAGMMAWIRKLGKG